MLDLEEVGTGGVNWIELVQDRETWLAGWMAGTCECGNEPSGSIKCGQLLD